MHDPEVLYVEDLQYPSRALYILSIVIPQNHRHLTRSNTMMEYAGWAEPTQGNINFLSFRDFSFFL